uniref:Cren protein n=1 Tax=Ignisphaera aggregans TaxID=334771 RepID=A0A7C2Z9H0_9CREN
MGLKHGKYIYIARSDGWYVKARVFKSRAEEENRYMIVGPKVRVPPPTAKIIKEESLPESVKAQLYAL